MGLLLDALDTSPYRDNTIVMLWSDRDRAEAMGRAGLEKVTAEYMHEHFVARMLSLAGVKEEQCGRS